jgi:hypothetical protein
VKSPHLVLISLALLGWSQYAVAQNKLPPRTTLVYVEPSLDQHFSLAPSDHLLVFQAAVQIPGVALPAGAYIFRLLAPSVVQVMSANRTKVYATLLTIPNSGIGNKRRERIEFELDPQDDPPKILGWYLADDTGHSFVYPKPQPARADRRNER